MSPNSFIFVLFVFPLLLFIPWIVLLILCFHIAAWRCGYVCLFQQNTAVLRALKVDDPSTEGCYYLFQMDHSDACHVKVTDKHDINVGLMIFLV